MPRYYDVVWTHGGACGVLRDARSTGTRMRYKICAGHATGTSHL